VVQHVHPCLCWCAPKVTSFVTASDLSLRVPGGICAMEPPGEQLKQSWECFPGVGGCLSVCALTTWTAFLGC
jgi:hypothetical protein